MFWTHGKGGLDVIVKSTHCKNCEEKKKKYEAHQKATVEYLTWCTEHEMKCWVNHEGSASVRSLLLSLQILKPKFNFISSFREFNSSENLCLSYMEKLYSPTTYNINKIIIDFKKYLEWSFDLFAILHPCGIKFT